MTAVLKGKVIIVTGGAGLLGQEFVKAILASEGTAIIADLNDDLGLKTLTRLKNEFVDGQVDFCQVNITSKDSILGMIKYVSSKYQKIDAIVNSAYPRNKNWGKKFEEVTIEDFCENMNMHLGGYFLTAQQLACFFKAQGYGNIINIASIYGVIPPRFEVYDNTKMTMPVEYAAIKSAIVHLTKYIAKYYKGHNIRVNCISPGGILDNQPEEFLSKYNSFCLTKGMLEKGDLQGTLVYLLSEMSQYVNGQNIVVDDGFSL